MSSYDFEQPGPSRDRLRWLAWERLMPRPVFAELRRLEAKHGMPLIVARTERGNWRLVFPLTVNGEPGLHALLDCGGRVLAAVSPPRPRWGVSDDLIEQES